MRSVALTVVLVLGACNHGGAINPDGGSARDAATSHDDASMPKPSRPPDAYNLGINVPGMSYYNNVAIYADVALAIAGNNGPWDTADGKAAATLDSTGAPTVAASSAFTANYPTGDYTVTWDGTGSIAFNGTGISLGPVTTSMSGGMQHNTATLSVTQRLGAPTDSPFYQLAATPPVTNLHILAPSALTSGVFVSDFLRAMHPFTTMRFMDALNTNGNTIEDWSERTWPAEGSRSGRAGGMAYEDVIALANATGADVWINVPVLATDDYVCRLARLFKYGEQGDKSNAPCDPAAPAGTATTPTLNGTSKVYVEYSNEIWNYGFQQIEDVFCMVWGTTDSTDPGKHCNVTAPTSALAKAALADMSLPWDDSNKYAKANQMSLVLTKGVSDIFRKVFGCASGTGCQVQIAMNVQAAYPAEVDTGFMFMKTAYGSLSAIDVMAVAPYLDIDDNGSATSVDAIFSGLDANLARMPASTAQNPVAKWLAADLAEATLYGLPVVAYEGGQGLSGIDTTLLASAEQDPRMYDTYKTYFALWDTLVGRDHLFIHYSYAGALGKYGAWGALIDQDEPGSQKFDALLSLSSYAGDANLDGIVDAKDCAIVNASFGKSGQWWQQGDFDHDGTVDAQDLVLLNANVTGPACTH